jgi:CheY-like chemotaxis protein
MRDRALVLDDDPARHAEFDRLLPSFSISHAYTAKQAIDRLQNGLYEIVFLDRDLNRSRELVGVTDPGNGLDVALYITHEMPPSRWPDRVWIHSHNADASRKMSKILRGAGLRVTVHRFHLK